MQKQLAPKGPDGLSDTCHAPVWILHFCTFFCSFSCKRKIFLGKTFYHENLQVQAVSLVYHIMSWCDLFYFFIFCKLWLQIVCKNDFSQRKDLYHVNLQVKPVQMTYRMCLYDIWSILGLKGARLEGIARLFNMCGALAIRPRPQTQVMRPVHRPHPFRLPRGWVRGIIHSGVAPK